MNEDVLKAIGAEHFENGDHPYWILKWTGCQIVSGLPWEGRESALVIHEIKHWLRMQGWDWFCTNFYEGKAIVESMRGFYSNCESIAAEAATEIEAWCALVMKMKEDK